MPAFRGVRSVVEVPTNRRARRVQRIACEAAVRSVVAEIQTAARIADIQAESLVASAKLREVNSLVELAMAGHTFLTTRAQQLAGEDILLADDLRSFKELARVASAEIVVDLVDTYHRR
jgi:hypothetical protein